MSDIKLGGIRKGGAVVDNTMSVGGGIKLGGVKVSGGVDIGGGGSSPVTEARWGQIEGNIGNQTDLMDALALKASASDLSALSNTVATKLTTPSGTNGQFMSLVNGVWTAVNLPVYEGGVN